MTQPRDFPQSASALRPEDDELTGAEGPATPEEDETFGPEPDDPAAAAPFEQPYEVEDFDPVHEERDLHEVETADAELRP